jgi:hypothetical protein
MIRDITVTRAAVRAGVSSEANAHGLVSSAGGGSSAELRARGAPGGAAHDRV